MFRSVLVPLDGTAFSEQGLALAEMVAGGDGTKVHLVSVGDPGGDREAYLAALAARLKEGGIDADHAVVDGKVVDAIEARARSVDADLIVMVTHGRSGLERLRLGSVAEGLVTRGLAPMLLLHAADEEASSLPNAIDHVVLALDHSSFAQSILDPLESLGGALGVSKYTIVHVADTKGSAGRAGWTPIAAVQARANERIGPIRDRLGGSGAEVDLQVVVASEPSEGILGVATDGGAGLIAMTTHGMTGVRPTLVGSVAAQVLRNWNGVLLLQRPAEG